MEFFDHGVAWWITAVELPVFSGLFWLSMRARAEAQARVAALRDLLDVRVSQLREALMGFKLEVAKSYAAIAEVKDLEARLVAHLLRIEAKLDRTALKAESLRPAKKQGE